ncbi:hypothetical protein E5Q_02827 [Mixia osmundae IAM 14324]|uniref:Uncharacterized protein n=1 Tax=Mixia osmundae (strain CBS 9802 / IAM 14324 / JCM 22182 / KY 12970) TaxID=764103 RepID=G7E006_MIXOS|nr:hypothetical protein E5Q_02827 [Mixia osmundae IAM 14324]
MIIRTRLRQASLDLQAVQDSARPGMPLSADNVHSLSKLDKRSTHARSSSAPMPMLGSPVKLRPDGETRRAKPEKGRHRSSSSSGSKSGFLTKLRSGFAAKPVEEMEWHCKGGDLADHFDWMELPSPKTPETKRSSSVPSLSHTRASSSDSDWSARSPDDAVARRRSRSASMLSIDVFQPTLPAIHDDDASSGYRITFSATQSPVLIHEANDEGTQLRRAKEEKAAIEALDAFFSNGPAPVNRIVTLRKEEVTLKSYNSPFLSASAFGSPLMPLSPSFQAPATPSSPFTLEKSLWQQLSLSDDQTEQHVLDIDFAEYDDQVTLPAGFAIGFGLAISSPLLYSISERSQVESTPLHSPKLADSKRSSLAYSPRTIATLSWDSPKTYRYI